MTGRQERALRIGALLALAAAVAGCRPTAAPPGPAGSPPPTAGERTATDRGGAFPRPVVGTWRGCGPEGDGGDPALNRLKNRVDEGRYQPITLTRLLALPWPRGIERQDRDRWSSADAAAVARDEGAPVFAEAYLYGAKLEGSEGTNCHSPDPEARDFHLWLTESAGTGRENSVVVEMSPRVRDGKPGWTVANLAQIARDGRRVRVSGWLMLDPEHPEQLGNTRGTLWEIHPITRFEVEERGRWIDLATGRPSSGPNRAAGSLPARPGAAAPEKPAAPGPAGAPATSGGQVWVNTRSGVYHRPGSSMYGRTKRGEYMPEAAARAQGYRPAGGE